ncbi:MAG TPA: hypothetical protein VGI39_33610 [Polyangiaceae bacterium]|jgi:hypothetical protein
MSNSVSWLSPFLAAALAACGSSASTDRAASAAEPLSGGALAALVALAAPGSPGGASLTADEAASYIAQVPGFDADGSVDALGVLARFDDATSSPQISPIARALRAHVSGLRIAGLTVSGLVIDSCGGAGVTATFDPKGAPYAGVTLVYSPDGWTHPYSAALLAGTDGLFRASLSGLDPSGSIVFAVALDQPGGDRLWLNNPREVSPGAVGHVDFRQSLALCEPVAEPTVPPFARLVQSFALADSLGGTTVTNDEFSWMVAQTTWEGGPGEDDPAVIDPTVAALDALNAAGVPFEGGTYTYMRNFLEQMKTRMTSTTAVTLGRNPANPYVYVAAPLGAQFMRVYYSTDGWNTPKVVECTPLGRAGSVVCGLGYLPAGALVSFSAIVRYATGGDVTVHAADGGNVFEKAN